MANADSNYKLGELDAKFSSLHERFNRLERKVDNLNAWRWKIVGATSIIGGLAGFLASKLI